MRYRNRKGEPITTAEWRRLYRDPKYAIVETTRVSKRIIETSWVGIVAECDTEPQLFLVQLLRNLSPLEEHTRDDGELYSQWCDTEAAAARVHRWLVEKEQTRVYGKPIK